MPNQLIGSMTENGNRMDIFLGRYLTGKKDIGELYFEIKDYIDSHPKRNREFFLSVTARGLSVTYQDPQQDPPSILKRVKSLGFLGSGKKDIEKIEEREDEGHKELARRKKMMEIIRKSGFIRVSSLENIIDPLDPSPIFEVLKRDEKSLELRMLRELNKRDLDAMVEDIASYLEIEGKKGICSGFSTQINGNNVLIKKMLKQGKSNEKTNQTSQINNIEMDKKSAMGIIRLAIDRFKKEPVDVHDKEEIVQEKPKKEIVEQKLKQEIPMQKTAAESAAEKIAKLKAGLSPADKEKYAHLLGDLDHLNEKLQTFIDVPPSIGERKYKTAISGEIGNVIAQIEDAIEAERLALYEANNDGLNKNNISMEIKSNIPTFFLSRGAIGLPRESNDKK